MSAGREPVMSRLLNRMRPRVGARKWVRRLKHVVLPAPLGPMSAWIVPRRTRRLTSLTATKPRNSLVRSWVSRITSLSIRMPMIDDAPSPPQALMYDRRMSTRLLFVGAGAIGSYLGAFLSRAGHDVTLVDPWPEQIEAIRRGGIAVSGPHEPFT